MNTDGTPYLKQNSSTKQWWSGLVVKGLDPASSTSSVGTLDMFLQTSRPRKGRLLVFSRGSLLLLLNKCHKVKVENTTTLAF